MKIVPITKTSNLAKQKLGGKAYNMQKLIRWGFKVPETFVITAQTKEASLAELATQVQTLGSLSKTKRYAVRSSGVGEDGADNSFAGVFDTMLDVKYHDLPTAIQKVFQSINTDITSMYSDARQTKVSSMAILIQEMVNADYAGVAFSVSPVESDHRIGLIEVVRGVGESLVSGKTTPTSVRFNKRTGMQRTLQVGADKIEAGQLTRMMQEVAELVDAVERKYKIPIDIEWAIKGDTLYLLQARPITTLEEKDEK